MNPEIRILAEFEVRFTNHILAKETWTREEVLELLNADKRDAIQFLITPLDY
jgi:hypothetical protein